jgi:CheY-like chemotaxis protein
MLQTLLEKAPAIEMNDAWSPRQKDSHLDMVKSILVVEDDAGIRDILGEVLQEETIHQVFLAEDGETALNMLQTVTPKLFLLDYNLPGMNGLELVDHIRRMKGYEHTPVVLMSAKLFREDITRPYLRYIQKPFDLDRLLGLVEEALAAQDLELEFTNNYCCVR